VVSLTALVVVVDGDLDLVLLTGDITGEVTVSDLLLPLLNHVGGAESVSLLVGVLATRSVSTELVTATEVVVESGPAPLELIVRGDITLYRKKYKRKV